MAKILTPREEKGGTGRRRGERQKEGVLHLSHREKRERERRWLSTSPKYPTSSNIRRTKLPLDFKLN